MKEKIVEILKWLGKKFANNCFYIIGFLCCFLPPLVVFLTEAIKVKSESVGIRVGFIIPIIIYLVVFFKFVRAKTHQKIGQWEAVNEIDENKHIVGILGLTILEYVSYLIIIILGYLVVSVLIELGTNVINFLIFWIWWFVAGIILMYIDKVRHILRKGLIENEENEIIEEVEEPREK